MASLPQLPLLSHTALPFAHFEYSFAKTVTKTESSSDLLYPDLFCYQTSRVLFLTANFVTSWFVSGNSLEKHKKPHRNKVLLSLTTSGCFQSTCVLAREALGAGRQPGTQLYYSWLEHSCMQIWWATNPQSTGFNPEQSWASARNFVSKNCCGWVSTHTSTAAVMKFESWLPEIFCYILSNPSTSIQSILLHSIHKLEN